MKKEIFGFLLADGLGYARIGDKKYALEYCRERGIDKKLLIVCPPAKFEKKENFKSL